MRAIAYALVSTRALEAEGCFLEGGNEGRFKNCVMGDNGFTLPDGVPQEGDNSEAVLGGVDMEEVTALRALLY